MWDWTLDAGRWSERQRIYRVGSKVDMTAHSTPPPPTPHTQILLQNILAYLYLPLMLPVRRFLDPTNYNFDFTDGAGGGF